MISAEYHKMIMRYCNGCIRSINIPVIITRDTRGDLSKDACLIHFITIKNLIDIFVDDLMQVGGIN
jgi:hypothetical protein